MTVFLINERDIAGLNNYMYFLSELPEYIESFKINFDLASPKDYGTYIEPALDHIVPQATKLSNLWTINRKPLQQLHGELDDSLKALIAFSERVSAHVGRLSSTGKRSSIGQDGDENLLIDLFGPLKKEPTNSVNDILRQCAEEINHYQHIFVEKGSIASELERSAYSIIPRIIDFMNNHINAHGHSASYPPDRLETAKSRVLLTKKQYEQYTSSACNMKVYCFRINYLIARAQNKLPLLNKHSTWSNFDLSMRLMSASLMEILTLSKSMGRLLIINI
ncbi:hypothetical protein [Pseudomonas sp.]|uniref:hypothetical protein n=1 Tax=Pseudomonas sp. TaxID=306 RepID=UPI003FD70F9E